MNSTNINITSSGIQAMTREELSTWFASDTRIGSMRARVGQADWINGSATTKHRSVGGQYDWEDPLVGLHTHLGQFVAIVVAKSAADEYIVSETTPRRGRVHSETIGVDTLLRRIRGRR